MTDTTDAADTTDQAASLNPPPIPAEPRTGVTLSEVRHVAALASLELTASEEQRMVYDLNAILGYVDDLSQLDTAHVEPLTQVSELLTGPISDMAPDAWAKLNAATLRPDEPRPSLARATVMASAPATDGTFFKVPKVIER